MTDEAHYTYAILDGQTVTHADCFLAAFTDVPCDGRMQKAHLIRAQVIHRELKTQLLNGGKTVNSVREAAWDERVWRPACYRHHTMLDQSRTLRIPREAIPADTEQYAVEHGLGRWLERTYGPLLVKEASA